jgi:hypothetical protein
MLTWRPMTSCGSGGRPRKPALWLLLCAAVAALFGQAVFQPGLAVEVVGAVVSLLCIALSLRFVLLLFRPRDFLRAGPAGIDQLAIRPHCTIPWEQVTDILVVKTGSIKCLGIKVRDPSLFFPPTRLRRLSHSRGLIDVLKVGLASLTLMAGAATGGTGGAISEASSAAGVFTQDFFPADFLIQPMCWQFTPKRTVQLLRARWVAAGGHPPLEDSGTLNRRRSKKTGAPAKAPEAGG